jgi:hypothetical protein
VQAGAVGFITPSQATEKKEAKPKKPQAKQSACRLVASVEVGRPA